jgi:hypothetical protein
MPAAFFMSSARLALAYDFAAPSLLVAVSLVELAEVSLLLESPLLEDPELEDPELDDSPLEPFFRLSVTYHPLPLKTIAGGVSTRRAVPEHSGQVCTAGASKPSRFS